MQELNPLSVKIAALQKELGDIEKALSFDNGKHDCWGPLYGHRDALIWKIAKYEKELARQEEWIEYCYTNAA